MNYINIAREFGPVIAVMLHQGQLFPSTSCVTTLFCSHSPVIG
jgi:hypothetical protein